MNTKKFFLTAIMLILFIGMANAQTIVKHIVDRGETLSSIAGRYGTSEDEIKKLNPDAAQFIYVGMELQVPVKVVANSNNVVKTTNTQNPSESLSENKSIVESSSVEEESKLKFTMDITYGFLPNNNASVEGVKARSHSYAYKAVLGVRYNIWQGLSAGSGLGYNSSSISSSVSSIGNYNNSDATYHFITLPIYVGWKLPNSGKFAIYPNLGVDLDMCVAAKQKNKSYSSGSSNTTDKKLKKPDLGVSFKAGVNIYIYGFELIGRYNIPLTDGAKASFGKDGYFSVGIGFAI